jgi:hypothetical protein
VATSPELASVWRRWLDGETLDPDEGQMAGFAVNALLRNAENVYLQVESGAADETALIGYGFGGARAWSSPNFRDYWAGNWDRFHPEFVIAFEAASGNTH